MKPLRLMGTIWLLPADRLAVSEGNISAWTRGFLTSGILLFPLAVRVWGAANYFAVSVQKHAKRGDRAGTKLTKAGPMNP
ncbi:hypothetical protein LJR231_005406 [Phyllobacterium sp. LjRoot231]|uniref:hypothetical protein n=1 Tax=Phyllobacterium sp. LjRoot231 TaxID=3342289 RepID=UPI003ECD057F